ncbi:MAG: PLP-dependent aminotransferase family protein [Anaerolineales bacterium]
MSRLPIGQRVIQPGIIDLGWGHPDPALLPVEEMRRACEGALARYGAQALEYGSVAGPGPLLEWLMDRIGENEGRRPYADELLITSGISGGLDLVLGALTRPNDVVLVESPTYYLAIRILRDRELDLVAVACDGEGMIVDELAAQLAALKSSGVRPRALYTVPTFNNPAGSSLAEARREALVDLAAAEGLTILEDDVYRELAYDGPSPRSLWSLAPAGTVARLGSFSKSLAPGLRLGWLSADRELVRRLVQGGLLDSSGGVNHFTALAVSALCQAGDFDAHVARLRHSYRARRDALVAALRRHLPETCRCDPPGGGFFVWVELPPAIDAQLLLPHAEAAGVSFQPGHRFHSDGGGRHHLRLAFSLYPAPELTEAARRLGEALRAFREGV